MGNAPKDYDVATDARPEEVRALFGKSQTLAIGQSFGVISVLGPPGAGQIDVATFRQDDAYSDGRHPDSVRFSTAELDAQRRDFTINGLFYDPLAERVLDYVGGQADLRAKVLRAIGDPTQRIAEDRLRMLRAVRFAARFQFAIEPATLAAIQASASLIVQVSGERIANELRLMLGHPTRSSAFAGLRQSGLLAVLLPERTHGPFGKTEALDAVADALRRLECRSFESALAVILAGLPDAERLIEAVGQRWRLANSESSAVTWIVGHLELIRTAQRQPWPRVQRALIHEWSGTAVSVADALDLSNELRAGVEFCRSRLAWPREQLDPAPLIDGHDLQSFGVTPGPIFREILEAVRDRQLDGDVATREQAMSLARSLIP
jgi:tRNA nucleotidyltransferase/poly(A) polymerase